MSDTGAVVFKDWKVFADTAEVYRRWEVVAPVPTLDLRKGDTILEVSEGESTWDGCRFQVRRPARKGPSAIVDELEDWQAKMVFRGDLPAWPMEGHALDGIHALLSDALSFGSLSFETVTAVTTAMMLRMLEKVPETVEEALPDTETPEAREALRALGWTRSCGWVARKSIPGTLIVAGCVVTLSPPDVEGLRPCRVTQVPREAYPAIADGGEVFEALRPYPYDGNLAGSLRKSYAKRKTARPETAPLHVCVPIASGCTAPIVATSDAEAMLELLYQTARQEG